MKRIIMLLGAALVGVAGCASPPLTSAEQAGLAPLGARLSIDGKAVDQIHQASCSQNHWMWTFQTGGADASLTAVVQTGGELTAKSVHFNDLDGFSGSYWQGNNGTAEATVDRNIWTISGTVEGVNTGTDKPFGPASRNFKLEVNC